MKYLFILILSYVTWQWMSLYLFATSIGNKKEAIKIITDNKLLEIIFKKTGLRLASIRVSSSQKPWGMMIGLPRYPYMVLSQGLYDSFDKDELEYVLLHESGHYMLAHSAKLAVLFISFLTIGFVSVSNIELPLIWIVIALIIGLIQIQMSRLCEYEADAFTLARMTNPKGMITATQKFAKAYKHFDVIRHDEDTFLGRLIYMGIPYNERIRNAEREIIRRKR
ncbi:MAG: M56 family metallopeptidase [Candidatus Roizmanbacteria bacterium]|nr:M56 family metallopeptidase [Candidatus Roizmanbacteria bacterium]